MACTGKISKDIVEWDTTRPKYNNHPITLSLIIYFGYHRHARVIGTCLDNDCGRGE